ncbi:MAG: DUF2764 family protein [Nitrospirales bacterium]|nr:MAG: DUF2764 family protein [Nitrospirales bacterium]
MNIGSYYFLARCFPPVPLSLGEKVPVSFSEICGLVLRNIEPGDEPLVRCSLMAVDTANTEYFLQGQDVFLPGGYLTREEIEGKRNLPSFLRAFFENRDRKVRRGYVYDDLWESYYGYAYSLAGELNCRFLMDYLSWEIGLRNSLVGLRARERAEEAEDYRILVQAGGHDFSSIISQLKTQQNPLSAERFLDEERLKQIFHCEGPDPFSRDAILGTMEKARIYSRWEKLNAVYNVRDLI